MEELVAAMRGRDGSVLEASPGYCWSDRYWGPYPQQRTIVGDSCPGVRCCLANTCDLTLLQHGNRSLDLSVPGWICGTVSVQLGCAGRSSEASGTLQLMHADDSTKDCSRQVRLSSQKAEPDTSVAPALAHVGAART